MKPSNPNNNAAKQVIYVDVDDEITAIIDKMNASPAKVVAFVLPKRAAVFQSIVNMKLLKRRAEAAKKRPVLITSEPGLMPLAALAGLYVAPTLQSKPEIPAASAQTANDDNEESASMDAEDFDPASNAATPVGALAGSTAAAAGEEVIELDNTSKVAAAAPAAKAAASAGAKQPQKDKKLSIPNFFSFRKRLILGALLLVLLIAGWYVAYFVLPKATVTIATNSSDIGSRIDMTLDTAAGEADAETAVLPAQTKQEQKSNTQQVPATGQENKGNKASGVVRMTASACAPNLQQPGDVPAGTGITYNGNTYITQSAAKFSYDGASGSCVNYRATADTQIVATQGGTAANTPANASFGVGGSIKATGSATGGSDSIVKVVQQADIDGAKQKLAASQDQTAIKKQLQDRLEEDNLYAMPSTFFAGQPNVTTSSNAGDEAETVTVTESVTYTMFGVKKDDLSVLVDADLKGKIDESKQSILDDGLADARLVVATPGAGPKLQVNLAITATAGPNLQPEQLKQSISGLKSGEVRDRIKATPGVNDVTVKYSPFWVTKAPKAEKITIEFEKSSAAGTADEQ